MKTFILIGLLSSCSTLNEKSTTGRDTASQTGLYASCLGRMRLLFNIKRAEFIENLRYGGRPHDYFEDTDKLRTLMKFVNQKRIEENFYFAKEVFYSIGKEGFSLQEGSRSFSGRSFIKKRTLYLEVIGARSIVNDGLMLDIVNSFIFTAMIAKSNYPHLNEVQLIGAQVVNEKLANMLHRFGFTPIIKGDGHDDLPFKEYFHRILNADEDIQEVDELGNSIIEDTVEGGSTRLNDLVLELRMK